MTRCTFTFLFCVCASFVLGAQDTAYAVLKFDEQVHWLRSVHEGDIIQHKFRFVNAGNSPLVITDVVQPVFTPQDVQEPIAPGDSGFILIQFHTAGKPGYFDKTATVKSNSRNGDITLHLRGEVIATPAPDAPVMKFDSLTYWFDTVYQGSIVDHEFRFTNTGKTPLIISMVTGNSGSIVPYYPKEPIAPGQSAMIRFVFNTNGKYGPQQKTLTVLSNASEPTIILTLKGVVIVPPLDVLTSPKAQMKIDTASYNFGTRSVGDTLYHDFTVRNTGREPLVISGVTGNDVGSACCSYPREPIRPGASGTIRIMYLPSAAGYREKTFLITSNDPSGNVYISVLGTVVARGNK